MKKLLAILLMLSLAAALTACGGPTDDEIKAVRNVSFAGTELTVTLGANKSTGYEWDYEVFGACIKPSVNRSFKVTGRKGDATGEVSIGFEGVSEGSAVIVFTTPNGWDGTGEGDGYTVNVAVGVGGKIEKANGMDGAFPVETAAPTQTPAVEPAPMSAPMEAPAPVPAQTPLPTPSGPKTTVAIDEIAEGKYTGTLSGDSYSGTYKDGTYTISPDISKATITVTIEDGKIKLYCKAKTTSGGAVLGVEAPRSPSFSRIVSGTLPLSQIDANTVGAEGDVSASEEDAYIYWNGDMKFDRWEIKTEEGSYHCTVTIAMADGVPTAKIKVDGSKSHRKATVPLQLTGGACYAPWPSP